MEASGMATQHVRHGKRRPWLRPWRAICRCCLEAWPCPVVRMRQGQADLLRGGRQ
jgi:hypothetical protein